MKFVCLVFVVAALCVVGAQETTPSTPTNEQVPPQEQQPPATPTPVVDPSIGDAPDAIPMPIPSGPEAMFMQVQAEEFAARRYLDLMLKLQHSQHSMTAGTLIMKQLALEYKEDNGESPTKSNGLYGFEEEVTFREENGAGSFDDDQTKIQLIVAYQLYYATKLKFIQTVFRANDVQREFWADRAMQLSVSAGGVQLPAQLMQLMYLKMFKTNLETIKLSLTFQYVSFFITWLEDELDVAGTLVDSTNPYNEQVVADQEDDLIRDKVHAFNAYNSYATIDFQIFYIDLYLESALGGGSMGSMNGQGASPALFMKMYKFYFLMFQRQSAQSALTSVFAEKAAYEEVDDMKKSDEYKTFAQQMYGSGFGMNLAQASQLEYLSSIFELYSMYAMAAQGSMGGNTGSSFV